MFGIVHLVKVKSITTCLIMVCIKFTAVWKPCVAFKALCAETLKFLSHFYYIHTFKLITSNLVIKFSTHFNQSETSSSCQ